MRASLAYNRRMSLPTPLSLAETARFLTERYGSGVSNVRRIGEGAWSQAYAFEHGGAMRVIRFSWFADNFERDAFAARFASDDLSIPAIAEIGQVRGHYYAVSPFVDGNYLERLSAVELESTLPSLLGMLRALRRVDLSGTRGFGIWDGSGHAPHAAWRSFLLDDKDDSAGSLIKGWRANLAASPLGVDAFERLWSRFERLVERCPDDRRLVHSDMVNGNVLVAHGKITAVLDWGSSMFGDPLYDVAWFVFYQRFFPVYGEIDLAHILLDDFRADPAVNTTDLVDRLRCYLMHIGLDSIAYNASRENWPDAQEAAEYTEKLVEGWR